MGGRGAEGAPAVVAGAPARAPDGGYHHQRRRTDAQHIRRYCTGRGGGEVAVAVAVVGRTRPAATPPQCRPPPHRRRPPRRPPPTPRRRRPVRHRPQRGRPSPQARPRGRACGRRHPHPAPAAADAPRQERPAHRGAAGNAAETPRRVAWRRCARRVLRRGSPRLGDVGTGRCRVGPPASGARARGGSLRERHTQQPGWERCPTSPAGGGQRPTFPC